MKKNMSYFFVLLLFIQCQSEPAFNATDANNGSSFDIKKGESFTVSLKAQLSTGFSWKADLPGEGIIVQKGKPETVSLEKMNEAKTGGFELQKFIFKCVKKGSTGLILNYSQPWTKKEPIEVYKININVK